MSEDVYTLLSRINNPFHSNRLLKSEGTLEELEVIIAANSGCTFCGIYKKVMDVDTSVKLTKIEELL
jgi:hypothetical protein